MNLEKLFKNLVLLNLIITPLLFVSFFFEPLEVTNVSDTFDLTIFGDTVSSIIGFTFAAILYVIAYIVALILLYRFVNFGKKLFLILFILSFVILLLSGPSITTNFVMFLEYLMAATDGAILVLLYFTPIKDKFNLN